MLLGSIPFLLLVMVAVSTPPEFVVSFGVAMRVPLVLAVFLGYYNLVISEPTVSVAGLIEPVSLYAGLPDSDFLRLLEYPVGLPGVVCRLYIVLRHDFLELD